jgi:sugar lactone lactonase YvrE
MVIQLSAPPSGNLVEVVGKLSEAGDSDEKNGDGAAATAALLNHPWDVILDTSGNIYVSDQNDNKIRKVSAVSKNITTIAGDGVYTFGGDGKSAEVASLAHPAGITLDTLGNLFIADTYNHRIRKVDATTGKISTIAGRSHAPLQGSFSGDGGEATNADLNLPYGVFVDTTGNVYVADTLNHRIRKIDTNNGYINTIAGNGNTC